MWTALGHGLAEHFIPTHLHLHKLLEHPFYSDNSLSSSTDFYTEHNHGGRLDLVKPIEWMSLIIYELYAALGMESVPHTLGSLVHKFTFVSLIHTLVIKCAYMYAGVQPRWTLISQHRDKIKSIRTSQSVSYNTCSMTYAKHKVH